MSGSQANNAHDAGDFRTWLGAMIAALQGEGGIEVPCGDCRGCCKSSYFIVVRPEDRRARAVIPISVLVDAPNHPPGHNLLGYESNGNCRMLDGNDCSIYEHRPQTCRDYDCRIFAAAEIGAGGSNKSIINMQVQSWRFQFACDEDRQIQRAIASAARFIGDERDSFPGGRAPSYPSGIAVLAIKSYEVFMPSNSTGRSAAETARAIVDASRSFDAGSGAATGRS